MKNKNLALKLTESAMMISLATILSFFKLASLPYGGSITIASLLPIIIIAVRYGIPWGIFTGIVHGSLQLLLDPSALSYFSNGLSVAAVIVLDYILAFGLVGLSGVASKIKRPTISLATGAILAGLARYLCHVVSGFTVWAGFSIPTAAALSYSFVYNATYMLPEVLVLVCAAYFVSASVDFRAQRLSPARKDDRKLSVWRICAVGAFVAALIYDIVAVFSNLQNGETGEFDITGIAQVNWLLVVIVSAVCFATSAVLVAVERKKNI